MPHNVRLCTLVKRNDFEGYGFNLHSEANKSGQYIGHVETDSPAHQAGLLKNDILVEVNGFNVCDENHQQVVARIKEKPSSVTLLIIDSEGYNFCKTNNIEIKKELSKPTTGVQNSQTPKEEKVREVAVKQVVVKETIKENSVDPPSIEKSLNEKSLNKKSLNETSNLEDLSIDEIRAKVAQGRAKKRQERVAPNSFRDRANLFEQL